MLTLTYDYTSLLTLHTSLLTVPDLPSMALDPGHSLARMTSEQVHSSL